MMESALSSDRLLVIFAQSPTGLGHLRVTEALCEALPKSVKGILLNSQIKTEVFLHGITGSIPIFTKILEYAQDGWLEEALLPVMNAYFRSGLATVEKQLETILNMEYTKPNTLLIVATHYGLAHQIGTIKKTFEKKNNIRIILIVVVTDDSPQKLWVAPGVHMTFVPSEITRKKLQDFAAKHISLRGNSFVVSPYIISPGINKRLPTDGLKTRMFQYDSSNAHAPVFSIPVSGAAAQLDYLQTVVRNISNDLQGTQFHIVTHISQKTNGFLRSIQDIPHISVSSSESRRETILLYEYMFTKIVVGFEITKPSEQAFKAMISPEKIGGVILLFSEPIGRQEHDNLAFLRRHGLIPAIEDQKSLWTMGVNPGNITLQTDMRKKAVRWRGIMLPSDPALASLCITVWKQSGIFQAMGNFAGLPQNKELSPDGAKMFWNHVARFIQHEQ